MMNALDMAARGFQKGQIVDLTSTYDGEVRRVNTYQVVPYSILRGNICTYFPETNPLIPITRTARGSNTPISKSVRVRVLEGE